MLYIATMLLCCLLVLLSTGAVTSSVSLTLEQQWASPSFWKSIDWMAFDERKAFPTIQFRPKKSGFVVKVADVQFVNTELELAVLDRPGKPTRDFAVDLGPRLDSKKMAGVSACAEAYQLLQGGLGSPSVLNGFPEPTAVTAPPGSSDAVFTRRIDIRAQWNVARTKVSLSCTGADLTDGNSIGFFTLHAGSRASEKEEKPFVWLHCSQVLNVTGNAETRPPVSQPDVILVLDEGFSKILNENLDTISNKNASFSDSTIEFTRNATDRIDTIRINRRTGAYTESRKLTSAASGISATVTGACERIDPLARKF
jgi:hypothetical protein